MTEAGPARLATTPERDEILGRTEGLLRGAHFAAAVAECVRFIEAYPHDLALLNGLGDVLVRAGAFEQALPVFLRVGDACLAEGFYARAAGFYKKILKFDPANEHILLKLAEACASQGLRLDARQHVQTVATARRQRGDEPGLTLALQRLAALDQAEERAQRSGPGGAVGAADRDASGSSGHRAPPQDPMAAEFLEADDLLDVALLVEPVEVLDDDPPLGKQSLAGPGTEEIEVDLTDRIDAVLSAGGLDAAPSSAEGERPTASDPGPETGLNAVFEGLREHVPHRGEDLVALGRTYLTAGLTEQAVEAFEAAASQPTSVYEASLALAEIAGARSDTTATLRWLESAASSAPTAAKRGAVLYRLGVVLEGIANYERAAAVLRELNGLAPGFRDVTARLARLDGLRGGGTCGR